MDGPCWAAGCARLKGVDVEVHRRRDRPADGKVHLNVNLAASAPIEKGQSCRARHRDQRWQIIRERRS
jgi:hypothetical protein